MSNENIEKNDQPKKSFFRRMADAMAEFEPTYFFGELRMQGRTITYKNDEYDIAGARATIDAGQIGKKMTATRVIGGGVLFGPVGALIGGMAKKSTGDAFLNIELGDGRLIVEPVKKKEMKKANEFAQQVNDSVLKL